MSSPSVASEFIHSSLTTVLLGSSLEPIPAIVSVLVEEGGDGVDLHVLQAVTLRTRLTEDTFRAQDAYRGAIWREYYGPQSSYELPSE
jgi:hypothetical protein